MTSRLQSSGIAALSFTLSASVLALALTPAMAHAATGTAPVEVTAPGDRLIETRHVDASDVDFADAADMKDLNRRINRAIFEVCREHGNGRATLDSGQCSYDARRSANQQIAALRSSSDVLAAAGSVAAPRTITVVASR